MSADLAQQLAEYQQSLGELDEGLKLDPKNAELLALRTQLLGLIEELQKVTRPAATAHSPPSSPPAPTNGATTEAELKVGTSVYVQWSQDNIWYEATIEEVRGPNTFFVTFSGYGNQEERSQEFIRLKGTTDLETLNSAAKKRKAAADAAAAPAAGKADAQHSKKTKSKKEDKTAANWRAFASSGAISKTSAPTKRKESIFRSPDSVSGKVGVTGSGKLILLPILLYFLFSCGNCACRMYIFIGSSNVLT